MEQEKELFAQSVRAQVRDAVRYLCREGHVQPGSVIVVGCSTSEITGGHIGKSGSPDLGRAVAEGALEACQEAGVTLSGQCCEHLNRALVLPREAALAHGWQPVSAVPHPHAGGSFASALYRLLPGPAVVERIEADAGIDIGDTLIGMHLRPVAVPLRAEAPLLGQARVIMAYTRPKYIGGARARYTLED